VGLLFPDWQPTISDDEVKGLKVDLASIGGNASGTGSWLPATSDLGGGSNSADGQNEDDDLDDDDDEEEDLDDDVDDDGDQEEDRGSDDEDGGDSDLVRTDTPALLECLQPASKFLCLHRNLSFPLQRVIHHFERHLVLSLLPSYISQRCVKKKIKFVVDYVGLAAVFNERAKKILEDDATQARCITLKTPPHVKSFVELMLSRADEQNVLGERAPAVQALIRQLNNMTGDEIPPPEVQPLFTMTVEDAALAAE